MPGPLFLPCLGDLCEKAAKPLVGRERLPLMSNRRQDGTGVRNINWVVIYFASFGLYGFISLSVWDT